jgi:hypothetical protein
MGGVSSDNRTQGMAPMKKTPMSDRRYSTYGGRLVSFSDSSLSLSLAPAS